MWWDGRCVEMTTNLPITDYQCIQCCASAACVLFDKMRFCNALRLILFNTTLIGGGCFFFFHEYLWKKWINQSTNQSISVSWFYGSPLHFTLINNNNRWAGFISLFEWAIKPFASLQSKWGAWNSIEFRWICIISRCDCSLHYKLTVLRCTNLLNTKWFGNERET